MQGPAHTPHNKGMCALMSVFVRKECVRVVFERQIGDEFAQGHAHTPRYKGTCVMHILCVWCDECVVDCQIGDEGAKALCKALRTHPAIYAWIMCTYSMCGRLSY